MHPTWVSGAVSGVPAEHLPHSGRLTNHEYTTSHADERTSAHQGYAGDNPDVGDERKRDEDGRWGVTFAAPKPTWTAPKPPTGASRHACRWTSQPRPAGPHRWLWSHALAACSSSPGAVTVCGGIG